MSMIPKTKHGEQILNAFTYTFNPENNGGESFSLHTKFISNGDDFKKESPDEGIFLNQSLKLQSYCNSTSINLHGFAITPQKLRELADKLEAAQEAAKKQLMRITEMAKKVSNPCEEELLNDSPPCTITF